MTGFEFNLEKVLNVRSLREKKAKNRLSQARSKARELESRLAGLEDLKEKVYNYLRGESLTLEENIQARSYLKRKHQQIDQLKQKLQEQKQEVKRCQQELIEKKKQRQVLEKLKEQKFEDFYKDYLQTQQKQLDEIGRQSFGLQGV